MGGILRGMSPIEAGFEGEQPLATFRNLHGFRVPGNDVLALDEVQTVLYTHMVITRFLYQSAGLNEHQSLPKKAHCQKCNTFFGHHLYSSQMLKQYVTNIITNTIRTLPSKVG